MRLVIISNFLHICVMKIMKVIVLEELYLFPIYRPIYIHGYMVTLFLYIYIYIYIVRFMHRVSVEGVAFKYIFMLCWLRRRHYTALIPSTPLWVQCDGYCFNLKNYTFLLGAQSETTNSVTKIKKHSISPFR